MCIYLRTTVVRGKYCFPGSQYDSAVPQIQIAQVQAGTDFYSRLASDTDFAWLRRQFPPAKTPLLWEVTSMSLPMQVSLPRTARNVGHGLNGAAGGGRGRFGGQSRCKGWKW